MSTKGSLVSVWKKVTKNRDVHNKIIVGNQPKLSVKTGADAITLDIDFYRSRYSDLANLDNKQLEEHWKVYGFKEGRYASAAHEQQINTAQASAYETSQDKAHQEVSAPEGKMKGSKETAASKGAVDLNFYLTLYPDLKANGITTQQQADAHFEQFGKAEGRASSLVEWAFQHHLPLNVIPYGFSLSSVLKRCSKQGVDLEPQRILDTLLGHDIATVALGETAEQTLKAYLALGKHYLGCQERVRGRALLEAGLTFSPSADALELLGNSYLDEGHQSIALNYYAAASRLPSPPKWVAFNHAKCLTNLYRIDEAIEVLANGIANNPNFRQQHAELERLAEHKWNTLQAELLAWVDAQNREQLINEVNRFAAHVYRAYLTLFGGKAPNEYADSELQSNAGIPPLAELARLNTQRILIVGDFHVPQCERYRINQKIEQLEKVGIEATAIDWTKLEQNANQLALHDVVIFYRVPAVPKVIKAIAQVNATGKLSFYEIDDLIFEVEYPPGIETYGGYVALDTYRGLTRGMALFNAAARLCRLGIASTEPLRQRLAPLVQEQRCLLHRNGLDHLNQFRTSDKSHKKTIDIFYGSGTQAHNSDFIEQALPAIERVLKEIPKARLVIVGYLRLPKSFRERFAKQYTQLPAIKSVQGYWSFLEQSDINIAVLHDDTINACKSELKWFEAACFGIPSVVSNTANYRDVISDGEDAFLAMSEEQWYSAIKRLAASKELRDRVGNAAMQRAKQDYSLEVLGNALVKQIEEVVPAPTTRKPKIALVNVFFPPQSIGGATRVVADNFSALRKHYADELDICVFTADAECVTPHQMMVYNRLGSRVYRATTLWREHMDWHPQDPKMHALFTEFLELEQPDIIHFHCVQRLSASIVEAARDAGVPYLITAHDAWWISDYQFLVDHEGKVYPEGHPDPFVETPLPANISREASIERGQYLKSLLHGAEKVLTVSQAFADIYRKNGFNEIEVIPNGISDDMPWAPKDTTYTPNVVCGHIGGMAEHKGYYLLKEAVMVAQPEKVEFLIVDHSQEEGYMQQAYWGKVPVTFIGRVSQECIVDLYRQLDVLFAPSLWPESFGLVTREAASCGCWVVASNLGGIGEDVVEGKTGYVIEPTQKALTQLMSVIQKNTQRYKRTAIDVEVTPALYQAQKLATLYREQR